MKLLILGPAARNQPIVSAVQHTNDHATLTEKEIDERFAQPFDWVIVNGYAPILKQPVIDAVKGKVLNIHPSYLPYGRGIFPLYWALFHGWPTGVTLQHIDAGIDTGAVLAQQVVPPDFNTDTLRTFNNRLLDEANALFCQRWPELREGRALPIPQASASPAHVSKLRLQSEAFVERLPLLWETPLRIVQQCGEGYRKNLAFLNAFNP